jgi:tetratricopeptide (TPR) repeat protein
VRKATALDPFHPTWFFLVVADYYFLRGEYEEALTAARKVNMPSLFWLQIQLAGTYAELDRQNEAKKALRELLRLYPGFTVQTYVEEARKWNYAEGNIRRWVTALRKAGLPE